MRRSHSVAGATKHNRKRIVAFSPRAFQFKFKLAAGRFDHEDHGREWILDERVDARTRCVTHPVSLRSLAEHAQDRGFEVWQPAERALHVRTDEALLVYVEIFYAVCEP